MCRVHVRRDFPYCLHCGTLRRGAAPTSFAAPQLRGIDDPALLVPLTGPVTTLGRGSDNDVVLSDDSVSRRHARIVRTGAGFRIEDLDSFNGTAVGGVDLHGGAAHLADGTELSIGDVRLVFEQPRDARVGSRTMVVGTQLTQLPTTADEEVPEATGPLTARPRRRSGWALKQVPTDRGEPGWVLSNTRTGVYLRLDEREVFLWNAVDGENTVRDLLFAYADRFGELALPRIEAALAAFADAGLLRGLPGRPEQEQTGGWRRAGRALYRALLKLEISVPGLDGAVTRLYGAFGWRLFTRTGVTLGWLSVVGGLVAFFRAQRRQHLLDFGGAGVWGPVALAAGYVSALVIHELTHALAVKSYGRKVRRGGFLLMMGMPFAFVDTSDMWFGSRWSRVVVALSGPLSTAALAGWCAVGAACLPAGPVSAVLFQLAFGLYLNTLYNFNPLMPLDGYQALTDALRVPRLREEASAYFRKGLWQDLRAGRRPGPRQTGMAAYGLAVVVGTYGFLVLALLAWRSRLGDLLQGRVPPPWDTVIVGVVVGLVASPVWAAPMRRLIRRLRRRHRTGGGPVSAVAVEGAA
ncbi:FHA domain-containing protein [Streptomyces coacervatus]|uniref:PqqD family peptide modification chaperone n=1 Tax=Streptomyces coacervatus TaxID=647381 RepID=UPI0023DBE135|nr:PqqD family peptide modification chaperone [Streptomyces coacervatus]MDF2263911.1 FHA domain-containing protein [Streptomyces coacervatus]